MNACYIYHPRTFELLYPAIAHQSPLEQGVYLYPANSTTTPPPQLQPNQAAVWEGNSWDIREDYRGETYWTRGGERHVITEIGPRPAEAVTNQEPFDPECIWSDDTGTWVIPFETLRLRKITEIRNTADDKYNQLTANLSNVERANLDRLENGALLLSENEDSQHPDALFVVTLAAQFGTDENGNGDNPEPDPGDTEIETPSRLQEIIQTILQQTTLIREKAAVIIGTQRMLEEQVSYAENEASLGYIIWPYEPPAQPSE